MGRGYGPSASRANMKWPTTIASIPTACLSWPTSAPLSSVLAACLSWLASATDLMDWIDVSASRTAVATRIPFIVISKALKLFPPGPRHQRLRLKECSGSGSLIAIRDELPAICLLFDALKEFHHRPLSVLNVAARLRSGRPLLSESRTQMNILRSQHIPNYSQLVTTNTSVRKPDRLQQTGHLL